LIAITDAFARADHLQVVLVDASTGKVVRRLPGSGAEPVQVAFSHDGSMVAATSTDRFARVWRVDTGERVHEIELFEELVTGLAFGPDDATLYTSEDGMLRVWDLSGGRRYLRALPADVPPQPNVVTSVGRPAPGGRRVAYFGELGRNRARDIAFLDVAAGTLAGPLATGLRGIADSGLFVNGAGDWHPDRRHYAVGDVDGRVQIWDAVTGLMSVERLIPGGRITAMDYTSDGDGLIVARQAGTVSWLDSETLRPVGRAVDVDAPVCCASVGPDGRVFVATGAPLRRGTFNGRSAGWALVDLSLGEVVSRGTSGVQDILAVAYSPQGDSAMVAGRPGVTQLIDLDEARPTRPPVDGHDGSALTVAYDSTGRRAVTAGFDGSTALWDGVTGELLGSVVSPERQPSAASFRDDGNILVATHDVGVFEWDTRVAHALSFACRAAGRDLTRVEWRQYLPGRPYQPTCPAQAGGT
jgi:WD40 repeat protein